MDLQPNDLPMLQTEADQRAATVAKLAAIREEQSKLLDARDRFLARVQKGQLTYDEFVRIPKSVQKQYSRRFGRPQSPQEIAADVRKGQAAVARKKAARAARKRNRAR